MNTAFAQNDDYSEAKESFILNGVIQKKDSWEGVKDASVDIYSTEHTTSNDLGEFKINARIGDQIVITHPSFQTIRREITSKDKLKIIVEPFSNSNKSSVKLDSKKEAVKQFNGQLNQAKSKLTKDASVSIDFVSEALEIGLINELDKHYLAEAYEVLGDIYVYWKQYDLALSNYRLSANFKASNEIQLKLAESYYLNKEYNRSVQELKKIKVNSLSNYQQVVYYEQLGDAYIALKQDAGAELNYRKGLAVAEEHLITPKITDLNSKIGDVYVQKGFLDDAEQFYNNSLQLAEEENIQRSIVESDKVADYFGNTNNFDKEIELRKKNLKQVKELPEKKNDSISLFNGALGNSNIFSTEEMITSQRLNYKIGDAYFKQSKFDEAIPYLKRSIAEANKKEDLIVEKDATRKLSEVYENQIDFVKAYETYQSYVGLVEKLYRKKEQEIVQASLFSKKLASSQERISSLEKERHITESKIDLAIKNNELSEENNKRQKVIIYSLIATLLLLALLAYYMFRNIQQQKLNNNLLALKQLRSQMNPHFIFNALNSVNSFIATNDERTANRYLSEFSQLMRSVLENSEEDFIPLSKEIELLEIYTKLEHFRFQDKFDYEIIVEEDVAVNEFQIPPMLLQPYVENAVWHGLRYKDEKGRLEIRISQSEAKQIKIAIEDDGIGRERSKELKTQNQKKQQSKGMGNIKKRVSILNEMYNDKVDVIIEDKQNHSGTRVVLTLNKD